MTDMQDFAEAVKGEVGERITLTFQTPPPRPPAPPAPPPGTYWHARLENREIIVDLRGSGLSRIIPIRLMYSGWPDEDQVRDATHDAMREMLTEHANAASINKVLAEVNAAYNDAQEQQRLRDRRGLIGW